MEWVHIMAAIVPIRVESCEECPHGVKWDLATEKWFCSVMKGKTFKNPMIIQDFCPYKEEV